MHENETKQMILTIIRHAQTAKPAEFRLLRNWRDYRFYKGKHRSFKLLVKGLQRTSERLFKSYCNSVTAGEGNFTKLLAYQQVLQAVSFYQHELDTVTNMLCEYETYLTEGNFWQAFLGESRTWPDMRDFRE